MALQEALLAADRPGGQCGAQSQNPGRGNKRSEPAQIDSFHVQPLTLVYSFGKFN